MSEVTIDTITTTSLGVKLHPNLQEKYAHLVPTTLIPQKYSFVIHNVSNAVANGLRRTICGELLVKHLMVSHEDIKTNDARIIPDMIIERIKQLPIDQSIPMTSKFGLYYINKTPSMSVVYFSAIKSASNSKPVFNDNAQLCDLSSTCELKIDNIRVEEHYGFNVGYMACCLGNAVSAIALDQRPADIYDKNDTDGTLSGISNPRLWKIQFTTNGSMPPPKIVSYACDSIIARIKNVLGRLSTITQDQYGTYILTIPNESDTIGNLYVKTCCELFDSNIDAIVYDVPTVNRDCIIKLKISPLASGNDADPVYIFNEISKYITNVYIAIREYFR